MKYWKEVKTDRKLKLQDYSKFNPEIVKRIKGIKANLKGLKVLHVNATQIGGGVAELLNSQVAFERDLGLKSSWYTIQAPKRFFYVTKKIHNFLHGVRGNLTGLEKKYYLEINKKLSREIQEYLDKNLGALVIVHDPQPLAIIDSLLNKDRLILRLHIDLKIPNNKIREFLIPYIRQYKNIIVSNREYINFLNTCQGKTHIISPAIDPLTEKNKLLSKKSAWDILEKFGLKPNERLITQVSRFDILKDPVGVVQAFKKVKRKKDNLQLVLAGFAFAKDDPEAFKVYKKTQAEAGQDSDIKLFFNPEILKKVGITNDKFINALYTASDIVLQKSKKEGFGLTITEAMWKAKPVIAGNADGPRQQISDNQNGILINSTQEMANQIIRLLDDEKLRLRLGSAARESVSKKYLLPVYILNHLKIYSNFE